MAKYKVYKNPANGYTEKVKDGFNWVVLLFGPIWYLFNSMVGKGVAWLLVAILAGSFTFGIGGIIVWIIAGAKANGDKEKSFLSQGWIFERYEG
ncbi:MAG: DUF2628 domain-containing protein [Solirubrobacterales bacterium]